jgi:hypothetical protein
VEEQRRTIDELRADNIRLARLAGQREAEIEPAAATDNGAIDFEDFYQRTKKRLAKEAPAILKTFVTKPQLEVEVQIETVDVDGNTTRGRIARLIAEGWLAEPKTANAVQKELGRLGRDPGPGAAYSEMKALAEMGFLFVERGKDSRSRPVTVYRANDDMTVNIKQRR